MKIATNIIAVRIDPEFGARITELTDLRSGRNWIVPAEDPRPPATESYIDGRPSGWDECFPTVASAEHPAWGGAIRDHGFLWGRPWRCQYAPCGIVATYDDPRFQFRRAVRLAGDRVFVRYTLLSRHHAPLPWLWSQHCLLDCQPGERIEARGIGPWKDGDGQIAELGPVQDPSAGVAGKYFAAVTGRADVALTGTGGTIQFSWQSRSASHVGFWFSYGGWPKNRPLYQLGIEPTNAPRNLVPNGTEIGDPMVLQPGQAKHWQIQIRLTGR
ncbi:hypothetical protein [Phaeobacter sp. J2-8]|uniref:hypothetical protein n=1 Tax=Phaeobacter sp. J2-8 TaxID=2931394 RepID=UPI001FD5EC1F|nr:hypothetical protein [Phaeobacter sp. J2-8]MCJ7874517.1 hypothetical protein [Phaeobacter sp. J2-8]